MDSSTRCLPEVSGGGSLQERTYKVKLIKTEGAKLGLDVDYMVERRVLPVMNVTGGLAQQWNLANPDKMMCKGDSLIEVNGITENVELMLEQCKTQTELSLTMTRAFTYDFLLVDLEKLITATNCGPILLRLSWHDAGVFSTGSLKGGCPNAAMRLPGGGEGVFAANAGLPTVALDLLKPISDKYCPSLISHADLWALAANVAIRLMGGPNIPTRFGRQDAKHWQEAVESQQCRLPDGDKGAVHLRDIFYPKGFSDKAIVALSGAHTVGHCHLERSGFQGAWTEAPLKFDNSYFKELLSKTYVEETTQKGMPQSRHGTSQTIMLVSDLAMIQDPVFKEHVDRYAADQGSFFQDFLEAWMELQENGCTELREVL
ncbi:unnamed protein product [Polarella glacialis]|uniref:Plant heme peroxidase family profile domain-containing protein n=1 Tax=Polarella glacialis TaxID=89957 RepID=A0A813I143_POLGL|nr:unnamed protein product [Polarella glacialis]